jgi:molecular chaperone HtpG
MLKLTLADAVKDVRSSDRLTESAVCLVADEGDMDMHLARLLEAAQAARAEKSKRVLEVNPNHALIRRLADRSARRGRAGQDRGRRLAAARPGPHRRRRAAAGPGRLRQAAGGCLERGLAA